MSEQLPVVYLARHGETAWSLSGQHTGQTALPLTERRERNARALGALLRGLVFAKVWTRRLQRAARTCELAGFGAAAEIDLTLSNGSTANMRGFARPRSTRSARIGNCSATAVPEASRRTRSAPAPIASWAGCAPSTATCCFFERPFPAGVRRLLARSRRGGEPILPTEHREPQRAGL